MKFLVPMLAAAMLLGAPCGVRAMTSGTNAGTSAATSAGQKEQYQKQVEAKLHDLDGKINELKSRVPRDGREVQKQLAQQMAELDQKRQATQRQLDRFSKASQRAWQDAKPKLDAALKDLQAAYTRAAADFK